MKMSEKEIHDYYEMDITINGVEYILKMNHTD